MTHAELPITGYLDRFSHRPGETFSAYVSLRDATAYRARLVRVAGGDPNPAGPGVKLEPMEAVFAGDFAGRRQEIHLGSHAVVENGPLRAPDAACTWTILVWAATLDAPKAVLAEADGGVSVTLLVGAEGAQAELVWPGGALDLATGAALAPRRWHRVWVSADPATGRVTVGQQILGGAAVAVQATATGLTLPVAGGVTMAADAAEPPARHFTGRLEAPAILAGMLAGEADIAALPMLAAWDFSIGIDSFAITDTGPHGCHGTLVNAPKRAVVGSSWSGAEMCWRHAPGDYAAIHFHDDDLDDCRWDVDFTWTVPDDLPSGAYALHLFCAAGEDWLPLYVLPKRAGPHAKVAFLASTFTYQAYANHARGNADAAYKARVAAWGAYPHNPDDFPLYGRSTYNRHADNTGISFSTRRRPILTMRPGFLTFGEFPSSGLRHYPADTHLLGWLEARGIAYDIVTDEDLDDEGAAVLAPYRAVLTGSHPEYHTLGTLDALQAYVDGGGHLAYLGGNGFYWRIARRADLPHLIELRRAEGGIRAWAAEPGEYFHQLDGQYGGLWRRNRRPPQMLAGVGFSGQGKFESTFYRRLPASFDPSVAWIFAGAEDEVIGDYGLSGNGAAGFEMDRADATQGTPANTVVLARAEQPPASFVAVPEELLSHVNTLSGDPVGEVMKAEMVYFETPSGGAVFSTGSITFCGSLWHKGAFDGPVSRILENVVRRFAGLPEGLPKPQP